VTAKRPEYPAEFEVAWKAYPPKGRANKAAALKAWRKAVKAITPDDLLAAIVRYAESDKGRGDFCGHMATWLNGCGWESAPEAWKDKRSGGGLLDERREAREALTFPERIGHVRTL